MPVLLYLLSSFYSFNGARRSRYTHRQRHGPTQLSSMPVCKGLPVRSAWLKVRASVAAPRCMFPGMKSVRKARKDLRVHKVSRVRREPRVNWANRAYKESKESRDLRDYRVHRENLGWPVRPAPRERPDLKVNRDHGANPAYRALPARVVPWL
jgi:hypothetical protein